MGTPFIKNITSGFKIFCRLLIALYNFVRQGFRTYFLWRVRTNWRRNLKGNYYNPSLGATTYRNDAGWNVVKDDIHYTNFDTLKGAQEKAYEIWLYKRER